MLSNQKIIRNSLHLDYFKDYKDRICQVFTWHHPKDRKLCIVKYDLGKSYWIAKDTGLHYKRTLKSYSYEGHQDNLRQYELIEPDYLYHSVVYGVDFLAVPLEKIKEYYYPEVRLKEIVETSKRLDFLELKVKKIAELLNDYLKIPMENMGITGSILWKAQTSKSDIDFIVYGNNYAQDFNEKFPMVYEISPEIKPLPKKKMNRYVESMARKSGLPTNLTYKYVTKKKWLSIFNETNISIVFSPLINEIPFKYGSQIFEPLDIVDVSCVITDTQMGFAYPAIYKINDCKILTAKKNYENINLERILSFEGAFTGYFAKGETVVVRGLLEKVIVDNAKKKPFYQIILGTKEGLGNEFILLQQDYSNL